MTRKELRDFLDVKFRKMFDDKDMSGFKVDDHWYVWFDRRKSIRTSYVILIKDGVFYTSERLGRYSGYTGFLNVMVIYMYDSIE